MGLDTDKFDACIGRLRQKAGERIEARDEKARLQEIHLRYELLASEGNWLQRRLYPIRLVILRNSKNYRRFVLNEQS